MRHWKIPLVFGFLLVLATTSWSGSALMSVQVQNGQLRSAPSFVGPVVAPMAYGDQVEVLQQQGDWMEVNTATGQRGWIHQSAVTKKRVVLKAGSQDAKLAASGDELALAGKGFNADVEAQFKSGRRDVDYTWVNRMESMKVSPQEMLTFLNEGTVRPREGGVK